MPSVSSKFVYLQPRLTSRKFRAKTFFQHSESEISICPSQFASPSVRLLHSSADTVGSSVGICMVVGDGKGVMIVGVIVVGVINCEGVTVSDSEHLIASLLLG